MSSSVEIQIANSDGFFLVKVVTDACPKDVYSFAVTC